MNTKENKMRLKIIYNLAEFKICIQLVFHLLFFQLGRFPCLYFLISLFLTKVLLLINLLRPSVKEVSMYKICVVGSTNDP